MKTLAMLAIVATFGFGGAAAAQSAPPPVDPLARCDTLPTRELKADCVKKFFDEQLAEDKKLMDEGLGVMRRSLQGLEGILRDIRKQLPPPKGSYDI